MYQHLSNEQLRHAIRSCTEEYRVLRANGESLEYMLRTGTQLTRMQAELNRRLAQHVRSRV